MRMRLREFVVYLLVTCIVFSPVTYYGQEIPAHDKDIPGPSAENARIQRELERYGRELSPEEEVSTSEERQEEEERRVDDALRHGGATPEERQAWEQTQASIRARQARNAEKKADDTRNAILRPSVDTFLIAPVTSEEYVRIYGTNGTRPQDLTTAQSSEISGIRRQMQAGFGQSTGSRNLNSRNFKTVIANSHSSFILILGHNDKGFFRFLDGSSAPLDDLVTASKPDQRMIIVSCKAEAMLSNQAAPRVAATQHDLTYAQAFEIAEKVQKYVASAGAHVSLEMVRQALQSAESRSRFTYNMGILVRPAVFASGAIVIALVISGGVPCVRKDNCR